MSQTYSATSPLYLNGVWSMVYGGMGIREGTLVPDTASVPAPPEDTPPAEAAAAANLHSFFNVCCIIFTFFSVKPWLHCLFGQLLANCKREIFCMFRSYSKNNSMPSHWNSNLWTPPGQVSHLADPFWYFYDPPSQGPDAVCVCVRGT